MVDDPICSCEGVIVLPDSVLASQTPSQRDSIELSTEMRHRVWGCGLIQEAGIMLALPQVVVVTAQNVFHRFFYRRSLLKHDAFSMAMGCVLLSSKVEENPKTLKEIISTFYTLYCRRIRIPNKFLDPEGPTFLEWRNALFSAEMYILKELGFSFYNIIDHPHKYLLYFIKLLTLGSDSSSTSEDSNSLAQQMAQVAWNYLNDAGRLDLSLRYPAQAIACAAIYMAARRVGHPLPVTPPWWIVMTEDFDVVKDICEDVLALYEAPCDSWLQPLCDASARLFPDAYAAANTSLPTSAGKDKSVAYSNQQFDDFRLGDFDPIPLEARDGGDGANEPITAVDISPPSNPSSSHPSPRQQDARSLHLIDVDAAADHRQQRSSTNDRSRSRSYRHRGSSRRSRSRSPKRRRSTSRDSRNRGSASSRNRRDSRDRNSRHHKHSRFDSRERQSRR